MPVKRKKKKKNLCATCDKVVYSNEKLEAQGKIYHDQCFKCVRCHKTLNLSTYKNSNNNPFCVTCVGRAPGAAVGFGPGR